MKLYKELNEYMKKIIYELSNNMKIKNKLMITYLTVVIATVSIVGIYLTNRITDVLTNNAITQAENNAETMKYRFEEVIKLTTRVSEMVYSDEKLHEMISKKYSSSGEVVSAYYDHAVLNNYVKYYKEFSSIDLYVDNNTLLDNSEISRTTDDIKRRSWYKRAIEDNGKISWVYKEDDLSSLYYLCLVRAIKNSEGVITGVLTINISPSVLKGISNNEKDDNNIIAVDNQTVSLIKNFTISDYILQGNIIKSSYDGMDNVIKTKFNRKQENYVIQKKINIEKAPDNEFQILIVLPKYSITAQTNKVILDSVFVVALVISLSLVIILYFSRTISRRINVLSKEMKRVVNGNLDIEDTIEGSDEIGQLYDDLITMMNSIKKLINDVYVEKIQKEKLKASQNEMELKMLASQINPHFLYNTLETIRMKAYCNDQREIADIVKKLGKLLRRNLEVSGKEVSLKSELDMMQNYLEIQSMRFNGMVTYDVEIASNISADRYMILPLLIQPIVENAFVHGIEEKSEKGNIKVNIFERDDNLVINITDNGIGIKEEDLNNIKNQLEVSNDNGKSIGMNNVNQRIKIYYGEKYGLDISSEYGEGTIVTLNLPR